METFKKFLNWEIILVILLHIFLVDFTFIGFFLLGIVVILSISHEKEALIMLSIFATLCIARLLILPILYNFIEKKSKQEILLDFISKLKSSKKIRIIVLLITLLPLLLFASGNLLYEVVINQLYLFNNLYLLYRSLESFLVLLIIFPILFGAFGSYTALFIWWKIKIKAINHVKPLS